MTEEKEPTSGFAKRWFAALLVVGLLLVAPTVIFGSGTPPTRADTLHVGSGYPYSTIGSALSAASTNDRIVVHPGTYKESVTLDKKVELHGTNMNTTIIDGRGASALILAADGCRVSGLNLTGGIPAGWSGEEVWTAGLDIRSDNNEIYGCYMQNNYFGILMRDTDDNWIHDSISADNRLHGIFLTGANLNQFDNLHSFQNDHNGFGFFVSPDNDFYHCRSENNGDSGWEIWDSEGENVRFSTASWNGKMGFMIDGAYDNNWIKNCEVIGNYGDGIWVSADTGPTVMNCTIAENGGTGIKLSYNGYGSNVVAYENLIMNNTAWAVEIEANCEHIEVSRNDFINNRNGLTPQVSDNGSGELWHVGTTGNYWSDWTSPDKDLNGVVDDPYNTSGTASSKDRYPGTNRFTNHSYILNSGTGPVYPYILKEFPEAALVDEMYTVYFAAVDKDTPSSELTWGVVTSAEWLTMEGNILKGRPSIDDVGIYTVRIWVTDGISTDEFIFELEVLFDPYGNVENEYPPSILTDHIHKAMVGLQYRNSYIATDPDTASEDLEWSIETTAGFLIMEDNVLKGIPSSSDIGAFTVSVLVYDGELWDISSFTLIVYPPDTDDDINDPELIDIEEEPIKETGEVVLSVKDLTDGKVSFIEFEWYIDGVLTGINSSLVVDLAHGVYLIVLRARALGNDWYEVRKEVKVNGVPDNRRDVDLVALVIAIALLVIVVLISGFLIFSRKRRRSSDVSRSIEDHISMEQTLEREEAAARRGPRSTGPRSSLDSEYEMISMEALTWKRPSRFTMERKKMHTKLDMKLDDGEIDNNLHRELADFIDVHFQEGND